MLLLPSLRFARVAHAAGPSARARVRVALIGFGRAVLLECLQLLEPVEEPAANVPPGSHAPR